MEDVYIYIAYKKIKIKIVFQYFFVSWEQIKFLKFFSFN